MSLNLDEVIPLGRCLGEYIKMFSLEPSDLELAILDCAGGAASFNAEMTRQGRKVISCDPVYQFSAVEIGAHLPKYHTFIEDFEASRPNYLWNIFESPSQLANVRRNATQEFLKDFPSGLQEGRYVTASLPVLPFENGQFDLALCSHFLFTDPHLSEKDHLEAITEMCRVAKQVRVFPLLQSFSGVESEHLNPVIAELQNRSFTVEIQEVAYQFQIGGNEMLRVSKKSSV
ncbi:MAG: class I SAM-dependent methyltransferase [Microcoleus sp. PH2017_10_PVI_O_A]|uniref:class I SAM-dependent methyltransferase n=1 Tax=unclassified Microcoleus TaxID=2642155 RepID=UPI001DCD3532|nr:MULTISPECIES: class I SAM-dependent methyltransferase [unclassified Microcoleus]TAE80109.1 MAG: class I SAM-dependent methyltransferase [Oscillatoriales cyanobacterium]MCC3407724.1 class I SAM-dependent methyltransferase [Microcoleus sp. PH2017_10_PVI_O_A]MCC3459699.1 class I SAM-dependent methyltransferase [Microcoleus sp. PH2017_11_PCY_U_A]MCC3480363.1 class I SAM-dependent methyltransferase [Microcoleus sp. PH2017_12_PCY_D_A]MCC3561200.1 class I SAM-dependent methyltransferase [Microcole